MPTEMSRKQGGTHTYTLTYNLMHTKFMNSTEHLFYITLPQLIHKTIFENRKHAIHWQYLIFWYWHLVNIVNRWDTIIDQLLTQNGQISAKT